MKKTFICLKLNVTCLIFMKLFSDSSDLLKFPLVPRALHKDCVCKTSEL
jgi:hypothetical protein